MKAFPGNGISWQKGAELILKQPSDTFIKKKEPIGFHQK
jgi:hypothetical protein